MELEWTYSQGYFVEWEKTNYEKNREGKMDSF